MTQKSAFVNAEGWKHPLGIPNDEDGKGTPIANYRCAGLADMAQAIKTDRDHRCSLNSHFM